MTQLKFKVSTQHVLFVLVGHSDRTLLALASLWVATLSEVATDLRITAAGARATKVDSC